MSAATMRYWEVRGVKSRTGQHFHGVMRDDGLQTLYTVVTAYGVEYISHLDDYVQEEITHAEYEEWVCANGE